MNLLSYVVKLISQIRIQGFNTYPALCCSLGCLLTAPRHHSHHSVKHRLFKIIFFFLNRFLQHFAFIQLHFEVNLFKTCYSDQLALPAICH